MFFLVAWIFKTKLWGFKIKTWILKKHFFLFFTLGMFHSFLILEGSHTKSGSRLSKLWITLIVIPFILYVPWKKGSMIKVHKGHSISSSWRLRAHFTLINTLKKFQHIKDPEEFCRKITKTTCFYIFLPSTILNSFMGSCFSGIPTDIPEK